jgi:hypothetical protein
MKARPLLFIIFLRALQHNAFLHQRMAGVAGWLRHFPQVAATVPTLMRYPFVVSLISKNGCFGILRSFLS